jgi:hypothetical protein
MACDSGRAYGGVTGGVNHASRNTGLRVFSKNIRFHASPLVVMRPILLPLYSVNQSAPSGPDVMSHGMQLGVGTGYCAGRLGKPERAIAALRHGALPK